MKTPFSLAALAVVLPVWLPAQSLEEQFSPVWEFDDLTIGDVEYRVCKFEAKPGILYEIQSSEDLSTWETLEKDIYGLGQTRAVAMYELHPPDPSGGGSPAPPQPAPTRFVSLQMQAASPSGALVTWYASGNGVLRGHIPETPTSAWFQNPLTAWSFGDTELAILASGPQAVAIPAETDESDPAFAEILALLSDNFAGMNLEVASRTAVQSSGPPVLSGSNGLFYRILADTGLDIDFDGTPDWAEWQAAAAGTPGLEGAFADAANGDTNGDGIPDGEQTDTDGDGVADARDADKADPAIDWPARPEPRFAVFPIAGIPPTSYFYLPQAPRQVNGRAEVLFDEGVWRAGHYQALNQTGIGLDHAEKTYAIDDNGTILGRGIWTRGTQEFETLVFWPTSTSAPQRVDAGENAIINLTTPDALGAADAGLPGVLSSDGFGIGFVQDLVPKPNNPQRFDTVDRQRHVFRISDGQSQLWEAVEIPYHFTVYAGANLNHYHATFGNDYLVPTSPESRLRLGGASWTLERWGQTSDKTWSNAAIQSVTATPGQGLLVSFTDGYARMVKGDCSVSAASQASSFSIDGYGLTLLTDGSFDFQGQQRTLDRMTSGQTPANAAAYGQSPAGHLLMRETDGFEWGPAGWLGAPLVLVDDQPDTGVDNVSLTSSDPGTAGDHHWLMVPAGGTADAHVGTNWTRHPINVPRAPDPENYHLSGAGVIVTPQSIGDGGELVTVTAPATDSPLEIPLTVTLSDGTNAIDALNHPLKVQVMPRRDLTVAVWPVRTAANGALPPVLSDNGEAIAAAIDTELNELYGKQCNVHFSTILKPAIAVDWNVGLDTELFETDVPNEVNPIDAVVTTSATDANVIILPTMIGVGFNQSINKARGLFDENYPGTVWMAGVFGTPEKIGHLTAHEMGHLFGLHHPDEGLDPAPLLGTDRSRRLMFSHVGGNPKARHLVKAEWDAIATWIANLPRFQTNN